jgi:hypothetical protein
MERGVAPAGVASSAMPPGCSGLAGRAYYDGLQVDLLDADWTKAGQSLPDRDGRGSFCPGPEDRLRSEKSPPNKHPHGASSCGCDAPKGGRALATVYGVITTLASFGASFPSLFSRYGVPAPQRTGAAELCLSGGPAGVVADIAAHEGRREVMLKTKGGPIDAAPNPL